MEKSLCPNHKDPPGIVTENIKLNWKHCPNRRHLWICLDISLRCEGDVIGVVEAGKKRGTAQDAPVRPFTNIGTALRKTWRGVMHAFCSDAVRERLGAQGEKLSPLILLAAQEPGFASLSQRNSSASVRSNSILSCFSWWKRKGCSTAAWI